MAAKEDELGALHVQVTKALSVALEGQIIEADAWEDHDGTVHAAAKTVIPPSAAIIQAATKFLKDNNITAVATKGSALADLQDKMEQRAAARIARASAMDRSEATKDMSFTTGLLDS